MPLLFSWTIGQPSMLMVSSWFGPLTISSIDISRRPIRLVNQLESGTSSIGVDVDRPHVAPIAGLAESVLGEVVAVAALDRLDAAGVDGAVVVDLQRIVGQEAGRRHAHRRSGGERRQHQPESSGAAT